MSKKTFLPASNIKKVNFNSTIVVNKIENELSDDESTEDELIEDGSTEDGPLEIDQTEIDQTDIKEDDEIDILDHENLGSIIDESNIYIVNLMNKFLDKYPHLDNYKNKEIIYKLFNLLVEQMPTYKDNYIFYINLLESLIKDITNPKLDDIFNEKE